jgi:hypothetical protein
VSVPAQSAPKAVPQPTPAVSVPSSEAPKVVAAAPKAVAAASAPPAAAPAKAPEAKKAPEVTGPTAAACGGAAWKQGRFRLVEVDAGVAAHSALVSNQHTQGKNMASLIEEESLECRNPTVTQGIQARTKEPVTFSDGPTV